MTDNTTLVLGGTGKTGRRVVHRLAARGLPVRVGSRGGEPPFEWADSSTGAPAVRGVAAPEAAPAIRAFCEVAVANGVRRLVLLSGRGEEEAYAAEREVQASGADWTILRASWFAQNFSEDFLREPVLGGELALPAQDMAEPFVDAEDVADVAVAALTGDGHAGQTYELTGPRLLTFTEAAAEISRASGREVRYLAVSPEEYASVLAKAGVPTEYIGLMTGIFVRVLDGRNAHLTDGVQRALGREPRDFCDYARSAAGSGAWR
jgi:uncharacterized protein YbjT (DUF2867 family)